MKNTIITGGIIFGLMAILGCTVEREVDFASGRPAAEKSEYFGTSPYLPEIETFMQIGASAEPGTTPDGRSRFFTTGQTGVTQLYRLSENNWPFQMTFFQDGLDWYVLSHSGALAIVGASIGGSEQSQLYLLDTQTGRIKTLTDNPQARYGSVVWSHDDRAIYYGCNVDNLRDFKLYRMDLTSGKSEKLVEAEGWNGWEDISLDGQKLIYSNSSSNVNIDLYLYDITTGQSRHLTPHEGDILYRNVFFSADGESLYLVCDDNPKGLALRARVDLAGGKTTFLDTDSPWNVDVLTLSPDRRVTTWVINENGYGRLKLAEVESGRELPAPELDGLAGSPVLNRTTQVLFTFNSPTMTEDIWNWDWQARRLRQVTFATYAGIDPGLFVKPQLVHYRSFDGLEIPAFMYLPAGYAGGPIPFIMDMHGGPESQFRPDFNRHFQYLLLQGFGILAPNVRGSDGYGKEFMALDNYRNRMNSVKDMKAAAEWLISGGYTVPGKIGVKGGSYGGYMTMAAITEYPDLFAAACNSVGIVNFVSFLENTSAYRQKIREAEYGPLSDRAFLASISPICKAHLIRTPLLVVHGANDPRVPVSEARQIINAIQKRGGIVDSLIFPDEGHGIGRLENRLIYYRRMVEFFSKYLKG